MKILGALVGILLTGILAGTAQAAIGCLPGDCCHGHPCDTHPLMQFPPSFYEVKKPVFTSSEAAANSQVFALVVNCDKVCAQCPNHCDCDPGSGGRGCE